MTQDEVYGTLLTKFFEDNHYPDLAWMHHIACKRYGQAAMALISVDEDATVLAQKYVSLVRIALSSDWPLTSSLSVALANLRQWQT